MQNKIIMIVEDDESICNMLRLILELEGYEVLTAPNGQVAIEMLERNHPPCLILLDVMMPVMNGWQFMEAVGKNPVLANIPVVIVTAFSEKARTLRSNGILRKPVELDALYSVVQNCCESPPVSN